MTIDKAKLRAFAERLVSEHQGGNGDPVPAIGVPAADVLALLAEIERIIPFEEAYATACHVRNRLIRENEALRKDAERYRWLRDKQTFIWLIQDWFPGEAMLTNVDADIDAAMGKGEQP